MHNFATSKHIGTSLSSIVHIYMIKYIIHLLNLGILQELAGVDLLLDGVDGSEVVGDAIHLAGTGIARGVRHGEAKLLPPAVDLREALHQQIDEGSLCAFYRFLRRDGIQKIKKSEIRA